MPTTTTLLTFAFVALGLVITPSPNMVYLISRSICQGRGAGLISLGGVALGFIFYMVCAALGITALVLAVPYAYDVLRISGAAYLLYLAWNAVRPGGRSPLEVRDLRYDPPGRLFVMGFVTNVLNPKAAVLYISLLPQFVVPGRGDVLTQSLMLGGTQIAVSLAVNALIVLAASTIAAALSARPTWMVVQRWLMATVLGGLAVRMATEARR